MDKQNKPNITITETKQEHDYIKKTTDEQNKRTNDHNQTKEHTKYKLQRKMHLNNKIKQTVNKCKEIIHETKHKQAISETQIPKQAKTGT